MRFHRPTLALALLVAVGGGCGGEAPSSGEGHLPEAWRHASVDPERGGRFLPAANAELRRFQDEVARSGLPLPNPHFGSPGTLLFAMRSDQPHSERRLRLLLEHERDDPELSILVLTDESRERAAARLDAAPDVASGRVSFHTVSSDYVRHPSFVFLRDYAPVVRVAPDGSVDGLATYRGSPLNRVVDVELGVASRRAPEFLAARHELTGELAELLAARLPRPVDVVELELLLDGGNLVTDGRGSCFATRVLATKNGGDEDAVARELREKLGCVRTIFLEAPERLDRMQHVDTMLAFADPENVILSMPVLYESDLAAEFRNLETLLALGYRVHRVPRLTSSITYANMLVTRKRVYVPQYTVYNVESPEQRAVRARIAELDRVGDRDEIAQLLRREPLVEPVRDDPRLERDDRLALDVARRLFPDREIVPVNSDETLNSLGSWHCLSHELPAGGD